MSQALRSSTLFVRSPGLRALALVALLVTACSSACSKDVATPPPVVLPAYGYTAPPATPTAGLDPDIWTNHLVNDLMPFWLMPEAKGTPVGNFPTYRQMTGALTSNTSRKPRMMGRQTYAYSIAFLMTGDEQYLDLARAGTRFLLDHALDTARGGWFADLDANGASASGGIKFAQDFSYTAMGPAAYFYVTRDPAAEAAVLATRDLLFDPAKFWDAGNGRIKDGMTATLSEEQYMSPGGPGSWQLVAQLDPITAMLLLVQPQLTDTVRRTQVLGDLRTLALLIETKFWKDGFFFGSTGDLGSFNTNHSDFGHMLKSYWALSQIDKRLADRPLQAFLVKNAAPTLTMAHDSTFGRWAEKPTSATAVQYGNSWWSAAESDQLAGTLALADPAWLPILSESSAHFRADFVDTTRAGRELYSGVKRDGSGYGWQDSDGSKCNEWKSGFHSTEHALVMNLISHWASGTPAQLYFAFPAAQAAALGADAKPYTFQGRVSKVEDLGALAGDSTRHKVRVSFDQLW